VKNHHDVLCKRWDDSRIFGFTNKDIVADLYNLTETVALMCTTYCSMRKIQHFPTRSTCGVYGVHVVVTRSICGVYGVHLVVTRNSDNFRMTF
jgi:hypothetical protein